MVTSLLLSSVYFTINPLKDNYIRINLEVTQEVTIIALQLDLGLLYLHSKIIKCNEPKLELYNKHEHLTKIRLYPNISNSPLKCLKTS